ncbi:hypothetical protein ACFL6C_14115, partial [Myxococcota bacterium]
GVLAQVYNNMVTVIKDASKAGIPEAYELSWRLTEGIRKKLLAGEKPRLGHWFHVTSKTGETSVKLRFTPEWRDPVVEDLRTAALEDEVGILRAKEAKKGRKKPKS